MAIEGLLEVVINEIGALPNGRAMAAVLKSIESDLGKAKAKISPDMHRANIELPNGNVVTVRVTEPKTVRPGATPKLRFKRPTHLYKYESIYFGGLASDGTPVVHKRKPSELGSLMTISLICGR